MKMLSRNFAIIDRNMIKINNAEISEKAKRMQIAN